MDETKILAALSYLGFSFFIGLVLAPLIYRDAKSLPKLFLGTKPWVWALCCLFQGPLIVVFIYWAIHHSSLSNRLNGEDL